MAKKVYGRILRKYTEIPGAAGPINTDGEVLVGEGDMEMKEATTEIKMSNRPAPFFVA
jgi:hypothetical protein